MIKLNRSLLVLLLSAFAFQLCCHTVTAAPRAKYVFIVSFDQGNPSLIAQTDMPTFHELEANGAHAREAYTIVPPLTLPSHTSMLTGVGVQKHQVTWNDYRPTNGIVKVPTIFSLAKERGFKTAMFVGKEKFKHLELPGTIDELVWPQPDDDARSVARVFATEFGKTKPNLCFIHFRDPDTVGHKTGAYSKEKIQALKDCDEALKTIKDAIAAAGVLDQSVIILTADHGSHDSKDKDGKTIGTHGDARPEDVLIPWVVWGKGVKKNFTVTAPVVQYDTAATALWVLGVSLPEHFWGRPVTTAFK